MSYSIDDVISEIAVAPSDHGTIYTASSAGVLYATHDGGKTWTNLTKAPLPGRWGSGLAVDPVDPNTVYAAFTGFSSITPSTPGHLFKSTDGGQTWSRFDTATGALDVPFESVVAHPVARNIVYAATEIGVLATIDGGASWQPLGDKLPHAAVYDLVFQSNANRLVAATHGRSVWSVDFQPSLATDARSVDLSTTEGVDPAPYVLNVRNDEPTGSIARFTVGAPQEAWLAVTPEAGVAAGTTTAPLTLTVSVKGLAPGRYHSLVPLHDPSGASCDVTVPVTVTVHRAAKAH